jgi:hypothetical protein
MPESRHTAQMVMIAPVTRCQAQVGAKNHRVNSAIGVKKPIKICCQKSVKYRVLFVT